MSFQATILMTGFITHDTKRFVTSRPNGFQWTPGQGVEVIINQAKWRKEEGRPFTPTSMIRDQVLEFTIKRYPEHHGVTDHLHTLVPGDELLLSEPFGTIRYRGKGIFLAAGAGITPFLAIFRDLASKEDLRGNRLFYSNKRPEDIICEKELRFLFGDNLLCTCTRGAFPGYHQQRFTRDFLLERIKDFSQHFYVCGPEGFVADVKAALVDQGAHPESLVFEE